MQNVKNVTIIAIKWEVSKSDKKTNRLLKKVRNHAYFDGVKMLICVVDKGCGGLDNGTMWGRKEEGASRIEELANN